MPSDSDLKATLLRADAATSRASRRASSWTLPPDLREEAVRRVRAVALVYALAYFLAGPALALITDEGRKLLFSRTIFWLPPALSIAGALLVAWLVSRPGIPTRVKLYAGLAFGVLGSYGIAASEYHDVTAPIMYRLGSGGFGLSWVAVWVMLFTVVVPTQPPAGAAHSRPVAVRYPRDVRPRRQQVHPSPRVLLRSDLSVSRGADHGLRRLPGGLPSGRRGDEGAGDGAARPQAADELAVRLGSVRVVEQWTPLRARQWWEENRPASPAGAAEPAMA